MSFILHLIGYAFVIGGIAWALVLAGMKRDHILIAILILVGMALIKGARHFRQPRD